MPPTGKEAFVKSDKDFVIDRSISLPVKSTASLGDISTSSSGTSTTFIDSTTSLNPFTQTNSL